MSKKNLHVIYVPGLGDHNVGGQQAVVNTWKWWGVSSELFQVGWADDEVWEPKFERLLARIDAAAAKGHAVGLVGASAGAAAVVNAFAARTDKVSGAVLIAGKVNFPERIGQKFRVENPTFITAAYDSPKALESLVPKDLKRILSIFSIKDGLVQQDDSCIPGAHNRRTFIMGHPVVIATQLVFGALSFIRFLKKQQH